MQSKFRFIGLPSYLLEDKTAAEANLFPLGHKRVIAILHRRYLSNAVPHP
jgi:hypothetical protein